MGLATFFHIETDVKSVSSKSAHMLDTHLQTSQSGYRAKKNRWAWCRETGSGRGWHCCPWCVCAVSLVEKEEGFFCATTPGWVDISCPDDGAE